ncbi:uncharacterized protein CDV56_101813 [Aspergillus thermomutatus]|uniref:Nucleoporin NUP37 n=1 Tax=Aspergillus thermomutatus TaxID=41047 RepID=A0A397H6S7_ASPTH|nr:uncharacterized protein CDV56_101813 [Aspergillus thermomutatus]RHZ57608.1 hypothetical protein CDV56_101813 [Aspergillus thermomutatus]
MPSFPTRPLAKLRDDGLQLRCYASSYQLPQRVHAAKAYPILAPNGSSIIVYGYENGLKVIWRGGKRFSALKAPVHKADKPAKVNSSNDDAVMIIDSDEESAAETPKEEGPLYEFEEDETEVDSAYPFEDVLRQIDIPLGSRVLELAVPRILPETARSSLDPFPPALKKLMMISAVCADYSTRIVTLPLNPPHPTQTELASWQVQTVSISGGVSHQEVPRGVSISFTCQEIEPNEDVTMSPTKSDFQDSERWDLLVATHSAEASGLLLIHRIPIVEERGNGQILYRLYDDELVSRRVYLPAPAKNISFNPSTFPASRHSTLLVAFHSGCVKVYSCFSRKPAKVSRRTSGPQIDLEKAETEGKWLISLYPGFEQSPSGLAQRKTIIDAEWVLGGRAVMVLMADGGWGVWDLEGAGPGSIKGPLQRQSSVQGVSGGSLTAFSVSGRILSPLTGRNKADSNESGIELRPKFAPMTPSTKRVREDTLLKGTLGTSAPSLCGEISVYQTNSPRDALPDESVLLRHGSQSAVIPSLLSLWRNAIKASGTFDASNRCRVSTIQDIHLMGENFTGIGHLPAAARRSRDTERQDFDILVTSEHRIIILAPKLTEPEEVPVSRQSVSEAATTEADQLMLRRGELDVDGMDRLLSGMASGNRSMRMGSPIKRARIFA